MNEINKLIVVRLEEQAGEIALLSDKYAKLKEQATKYRRWWSEEQDTTTQQKATIAVQRCRGDKLEVNCTNQATRIQELEAQVKDLQAKLLIELVPDDGVNNLDGPPELDPYDEADSKGLAGYPTDQTE